MRRGMEMVLGHGAWGGHGVGMTGISCGSGWGWAAALLYERIVKRHRPN